MPKLDEETTEREARALMAFERNSQWAFPSTSFSTQLSPEEEKNFQKWVKANKIPFNPEEAFPDYDMRGWWKASTSGDPSAKYDPKRMHFTDKFKTPFHESFSRESMYANPNTAPYWKETKYGNALMTPQGQVVFAEDAKGNPLKGY